MIKKLLHIKRMKCGPAEIEFFGNVPLPDTSDHAASVRVSITPDAKQDAKRYRLSRKQILKELMYMLRRHERLLSGSFVSMPLHILGHITMVSYTVNSGLAIERILPVSKKTPLYEGWAELLSFYRRVAGLSYRIDDPSVLLHDQQARRTLRALASLCKKCGTYVVLYHRCHPYIEVTWDQHNIDILMREVELFLNDGDVGSAVARIEILLSNAHRMLLSCAPTSSVADAVSSLTDTELQSQPKKADRRVLVIEDEEVNRQLFQEILEYAGLTVEVVSDGNEALQLLLTRSYDLIVTDIVMPGLSGIDVARIARVFNSGQLSIGLSGYFSEDDPEVAKTFDIYYRKPFGLSNLTEGASNLLEGKKSEDSQNPPLQPTGCTGG